MLSIFAKAPVLSAFVGLTLVAGGAWAALGLCGGACGTSSDTVAAESSDAQVILTATAEAAPADGKSADCDKPCPFKGGAETTTAAVVPAAAPADGEGSDCHRGAKATTVATAPKADAAPADGKGSDCDKPCPKAAEAKGTVAAAPAATGDGSTDLE